MKRRDLLKGIAASATLGTVGVLATQQQPAAEGDEAFDLRMRKVFKIIEKDPVTHIKIGNDDYHPTERELESVVSAFRQAEEHGHAASSVITPFYVQIDAVPNCIMVSCECSDLKKGDIFVLYEPTGELVRSTFKLDDEVASVRADYSILLCNADASFDSGVWGVDCDPVTNAAYVIPPMCPT